MSYAFNDDPTIPPPGKRSGKGADSVVPFLKKSLASKPKPTDRDDTTTRARPVARGFERDDETPSTLDFEL